MDDDHQWAGQWQVRLGSRSGGKSRLISRRRPLSRRADEISEHERTLEAHPELAETQRDVAWRRLATAKKADRREAVRRFVATFGPLRHGERKKLASLMRVNRETIRKWLK